jgi:hypothetical protein
VILSAAGQTKKSGWALPDFSNDSGEIIQLGFKGDGIDVAKTPVEPGAVVEALDVIQERSASLGAIRPRGEIQRREKADQPIVTFCPAATER